MDALKRLTQLDDRPFGSIPDPRYYFPAEVLESARGAVVRAIRRAEGPAVIVGGAGLGKSMLLQVVAQDVGDQFDVVPIIGGNINNRQTLLQNILYELQLPYRDLSEGELRLAILDRLAPNADYAPGGICLLVDEAHALPTELLEELRLMTNFTRNGSARVRLVLAGCPELEEIFADPALELLNQRVAVRSYLSPMTRQETSEYIRHQFAVAGVDPVAVITNDALAAAHTGSEGIPRLVNQIIDHAIVLAVAQEQCPISVSLIDEAWADLQQIPTPWTEIGAAKSEAAGNQAPAIEFGTLDDHSDEPCAVEFDSPPSAECVDRSDGTDAGANLETDLLRDRSPLRESSTDAPRKKEGDAPTDEREQPQEGIAEASVESFDTRSADATTADGLVGLFDYFAAFTPDTLSVADGHQGAIEPSAEAWQIATDADGQGTAHPEIPSPDSQAVEPCRVEEGAGRSMAGPAEQETDCENRQSCACQPLPVDESDERMTALAEEQRHFETLGFWEQDPPIRTDSHSAAVPAAGVPHDLFGADFDEELEIPAIPLGSSAGESSRPETGAAPPPADGESRITPPESVSDATSENTTTVPNPLGPEHMADAAASKPPVPTPGIGVDDFLLDATEFQLSALSANEQVITETYDLSDLMEPPIPTGTSDFAEEEAGPSPRETVVPAPSTVDVAPDAPRLDEGLLTESLGAIQPFEFAAFPADLSQELQLHGDIEKLISQLNFSAFAVETELAEEIQGSLRGAVRQGTGDKAGEFYTKHTPRIAPHQQLFSSDGMSQDDDRDLLIVESDIAVTDSISSPPSDRPVVRNPPYAQLFSRLRKG